MMGEVCNNDFVIVRALQKLPWKRARRDQHRSGTIGQISANQNGQPTTGDVQGCVGKREEREDEDEKGERKMKIIMCIIVIRQAQPAHLARSRG